jgi:membrane protein
MTEYFAIVRKALLRAFDHDVVNTSKAAAYSGMLMMFPALLVITTLLALVQEGTTLVGELRGTFEQFLPADTLDLLQSYILTRRVYSGQLVLSAVGLSVFAGLGMMLSLMEGFRRAYGLSPQAWGFWARRLRALLLVPIALIPLSVASLVVIFGHQIERWMIDNAGHELRHIVLFAWRMVRWAVALITSATVLSAVYHFGTRRAESWHRVLPGAISGTLLWFPATLAFGWYVTRIADYSMFYGSFGAGIATLVWLYITAFSVLLGAEVNGALYWDRHESRAQVSQRTPAEATRQSDTVSSAQ